VIVRLQEALSGAQAIARRKVTEEPLPLRPLRPEVPVALDRAVRKAMAVAPEQRFPEVGELSKELDRAAGMWRAPQGWTLLAAIATALRADLSQSRFVRVVEPREIRSALQRMQWTDDATLDLSRAREVARRGPYASAPPAGGAATAGAARTTAHHGNAWPCSPLSPSSSP
jgi:hypothetical protein